ncbi:MAG TPA: STAUR_1299 family protein [Kofleriaceae bacterium]|jgi:hypothetical protein|nr:STAUR_1299 family protein [Kofleriaceae bacterium]
MSIDLSPVLEKAFFVEDVQNASEAIARAEQTFEQATRIGARGFEIVAPIEPDEPWLREQLVHRLVYVCESEGVPVPECSGTLVELFIGGRLYAIPAGDVIRWASRVLHTPIEQLRMEYGTHEIETARR